MGLSLLAKQNYTKGRKIKMNGRNVDDSEAKRKAMELLRERGFQFVQQPDLLAKKDGTWIIVEVKDKEIFEPGPNFPHYGVGLDHSQLYLRMQPKEDLGLRTYLLYFVKGTGDIYGEYLDELERKGGYLDTEKQHIRIYPIESYTKLV